MPQQGHKPILNSANICFHTSHQYIMYCSCTTLPSYFLINYHTHLCEQLKSMQH